MDHHKDAFRESIIHQLRMRGWSRSDAEDEADEKIARAPPPTVKE